MSRRIHQFFAIVLGLTLLPAAGAATIVCEGTIVDLTIHQPGLVGLRLSSMSSPMYICRVDAEYRPLGADSISPATCKTMYAGLLAAKYSNATVRAAYFDGDQVPASCDTTQSGAQVFLRHFAL